MNFCRSRKIGGEADMDNDSSSWAIWRRIDRQWDRSRSNGQVHRPNSFFHFSGEIIGQVPFQFRNICRIQQYIHAASLLRGVIRFYRISGTIIQNEMVYRNLWRAKNYYNALRNCVMITLWWFWSGLRAMYEIWTEEALKMCFIFWYRQHYSYFLLLLLLH